MSKTVCLTGATGQVASYLIELLLEDPNENYIVHGLKRSCSNTNTERIDHIFNNPKYKDRFFLHYGDLGDTASINAFVADQKPDYFFNCGAVSHVRTSFDIPEYTYDITGIGTLRILESIRKHSPQTRFLQCSTSELYGGMTREPQNETTPFYPRSPYATAKLASFWTVKNYRESYGLFAANAISFNHESPRRAHNFFTKKIIKFCCRAKLGLEDSVNLGYLGSYRDFSHAKDIAEGLIKITNHDTPEEFVLASGKTISMQKFVEKVFGKLNLDYHKYIKFDQRLTRPNEVEYLHGDASKAAKILNWAPKYTLDMLIDEMIEYELNKIGNK